MNKPLSMKNLILSLISILLISSCVSVEFTSPQPSNEKSLKKFPKKLRGEYQVQILSNGESEPEEASSDKIIIGENYYEELGKVNKNNKVYLSDSCVLKPYNKDYFINFKNRTEVNWTSALLKFNEKGNLVVYGLFAGEDMEEKPFIEALNAITPVHRLSEDEVSTKYDISPSKEELSRLITERYFKPVYELIRIKE